jgi:hypothetical protein
VAGGTLGVLVGLAAAVANWLPTALISMPTFQASVAAYSMPALGRGCGTFGSMDSGFNALAQGVRSVEEEASAEHGRVQHIEDVVEFSVRNGRIAGQLGGPGRRVHPRERRVGSNAVYSFRSRPPARLNMGAETARRID